MGELAIVGVIIDQYDVKRKFLRSLGDEWTTYTVLFRLIDNLEDKELDDIYNDLRLLQDTLVMLLFFHLQVKQVQVVIKVLLPLS